MVETTSRKPYAIFDSKKLRLNAGYWYLATPYSKYEAGIDAAFLHACSIAGQLISAKISVYSPIAHTHPIAIASGIDPLNHRVWLAADEAFIQGAHGLLLAELPGWKESKGVHYELDRFARFGKPIRNMEIEWR